MKFVIADRVDYEYAREIVARERLAERCGAVLFSPVHGVLEPQAAGRVGAGRSTAGAPAAPDAQVHLGPADARSLNGGERLSPKPGVGPESP